KIQCGLYVNEGSGLIRGASAILSTSRGALGRDDRHAGDRTPRRPSVGPFAERFRLWSYPLPVPNPAPAKAKRGTIPQRGLATPSGVGGGAWWTYCGAGTVRVQTHLRQKGQCLRGDTQCNSVVFQDPASAGPEKCSAKSAGRGRGCPVF